jgi:hypothetical protein
MEAGLGMSYEATKNFQGLGMSPLSTRGEIGGSGKDSSILVIGH